MRKFLIALLMVPMLANAEAIFQTNNKAGGKIILTDEACRDGSHHLAYSMMPGYSTLLGCWSADSQYVHVAWYDGDLRSYPVDRWIYIGKETKPNL